MKGLTTSQINTLTKYWEEGAEKDLSAAESLFKNKHYPQSLFFLHLALEKLLKSRLVRNAKIVPPLSHDLVRLSELANLDSKEQKPFLRIANQFNIRARYDDYKRAFSKLATKSFTQSSLKQGKAVFVWIKRSTQKKK